MPPQPAAMTDAKFKIETIDVPEFHRRLKAQGVANRDMALICPICGTVQSMASLVRAGATVEQAENAIGFACEGRFSGAGPWPNHPSARRRKVRGCDWSLGGLFKLHELEVVDEGKSHPRFVVATPDQALALLAIAKARGDS